MEAPFKNMPNLFWHCLYSDCDPGKGIAIESTLRTPQNKANHFIFFVKKDQTGGVPGVRGGLVKDQTFYSFFLGHLAMPE